MSLTSPEETDRLNSDLDGVDNPARLIKEWNAREAIYQELFTSRPRITDRVISFFQDVRDYLKTGKKVDRPEITGGPGESLTVTIAGRDLTEFLPNDPDYQFLGVRVTKPTKTVLPSPTESSSPRFNVSNKKVELVVAVDPGAQGKRTAKIPHASLSILHEIGHAIDEFKNHRFIRILYADVLARLSPQPSSFGPIFGDHLHFLAQGGKVDTEIIKESLERYVEYLIDKELYIKGQYTTQAILKLWAEDIDAFKEKFINENLSPVWSIYLKARKAALGGQAEEAIQLAKDSFLELQEKRREESEEIRRKTTAVSEREAWAEALVLARKLIKENRARLWRGNLKSLFFEIDKIINAHGLAGRYGVTRPSSRERLHLPVAKKRRRKRPRPLIDATKAA